MFLLRLIWADKSIMPVCSAGSVCLGFRRGHDEDRFADEILSAADLGPHGHAHADRKVLDLGDGLHRVTIHSASSAASVSSGSGRRV